MNVGGTTEYFPSYLVRAVFLCTRGRKVYAACAACPGATSRGKSLPYSIAGRAAGRVEGHSPTRFAHGHPKEICRYK